MEPPELAAHLKTLNVSLEAIISAARILAEEDLAHYRSTEAPDTLVEDCIVACVEQLRGAGMAMYASYK